MKIALQKVPLFSSLSDSQIALLESVSMHRTFEKGQTIIHKSDRGDTFFSILTGKVRVILTDEEGKEFIVGILKQFDFFGELSLLDGEPRSATIVSQDATEVLVIKRDDFLKLITKHPEMCIKILEVLGSRLRKANQHIESLVFLDVCGRLARMLLDMGESADASKTDQGTVIEVEYSRTDLANLVGTTRETLTRALKTLENMGYILIRKNRLVITNESGLRTRMY